LLEGCPIVTIPRALLIASEPYGPRLSAAKVAAAIAGGVLGAGHPEPDAWALEAEASDPAHLRALLDAAGFDARMRAARALLIAVPRLQERTLAGSLAFEVATRARQAGVPAYAITAEDELDAFDARILDLQSILRARTAKALGEAGAKLAAIA
jgi:glycerate 2-kinase